MKALFVLLALFALGLGVFLILSEGHTRSSVAPPTQEEESAESFHNAELVTPGELPRVAGDPEEEPAAEKAPSPARRPISAPAETPLEVCVFGVVVDSRGHPMPETQVGLSIQREEEDLEIFRSFGSGSIGIQDLGRKQIRVVRTDKWGAFDLGTHLAADLAGAQLSFAMELYAGSPPSAPVTLDNAEHYLKLPEPPTCRLEVTLDAPEDAASVPYPEWAALDLIQASDGTAVALRKPEPADVLLSSGRLTALGLAPGRWSVWVRCHGFPPAHKDITVSSESELTRATLELGAALPDPGFYSRVQQHFEEGRPRQDPTYGFDAIDIQGQSPRLFRDPGYDKWFAHTIDGFGQGPVRSAYLEIELGGQQGVGHNDTLNFEFRGWDARPRWAYGERLSELIGKGWTERRRHRLYLDLSTLTRDGKVTNLLPELEDGRLDIYVQDDTAVWDVALHVRR